jgi:hypothetical protein
VRRAGASGELTMRMDSGFWSAKTITACRRHGIRYSITVRQTKPIRAAIATLDEAAWADIVYPQGGVAQVAETCDKGDRLIVRRTRLLGAQQQLFPTWRYHALSPTGSAAPSNSTPTTAVMPWSSCASATSKPVPAYGTAPRASSPPTPPGWWRPAWPTTYCAGSPRSDWASVGWWSPRRYGAPCCTRPGG